MDRVEYAAKNLKFTAAGELVLAILKFVSRRVFVILLGKEYLGISGLFTDILSLLSLAELGFGVSITYSLYRPAARGGHGDDQIPDAAVPPCLSVDRSDSFGRRSVPDAVSFILCQGNAGECFGCFADLLPECGEYRCVLFLYL